MSTSVRYAVGWTKANLFRSLGDALVTLAVGAGLALFAGSVGRWAVVEADWSVVTENFRFLMVGTLPFEDTWRAEFAGVIVVALAWHSFAQSGLTNRQKLFAIAVAVAVAGVGYFGTVKLATWVGLAIASLCLVDLVGLSFLRPLKAVGAIWLAVALALGPLFAMTDIDKLGGILLSVLLTVVTAISSLPLGILLALGRRSSRSGIRIACTAYIEFVRSLPLLLVVYWIWLTMPLVIPEWQMPDIARAAGAFALFVSAYVAEYVRTGLQAVATGQTEAAQSLGLRSIDINRFIVVPQAIRTVLPALVGNVLEIFNAVPLLFIIGSVDLLRAGQIILSNPRYGANSMEVYVFIFMIYLAIGSLLTFASRRLEHRAFAAR